MVQPSIYILLKILIYVKGMSCFGNSCEATSVNNNRGLKNYLEKYVSNPLLTLNPQAVEELKRIKGQITNRNTLQQINTLLSRQAPKNVASIEREKRDNITFILEKLRTTYKDDYNIIKNLNKIINGNYNKEVIDQTRRILNDIWPFLNEEAKQQNAKNANARALVLRRQKLASSRGGMIRRKVYTRKNRKVKQRARTLKHKKHGTTT
jgi:hypothetical protein